MYDKKKSSMILPERTLGGWEMIQIVVGATVRYTFIGYAAPGATHMILSVLPGPDAAPVDTIAVKAFLSVRISYKGSHRS